MSLSNLTSAQRTELEAAAFRRLVAHLQARTDVQNIDLMTLSGFCRNCLSRWIAEAASDGDIDLDRDEARLMIYGMAYEDWKAKYQSEATAEQQAALKAASQHD